ncbi:tRNA epoxyqueuosine(34) reductase QueG [Tissierella creatinini]|nr:tRNA epoxyqueuosine(34) reductase QueG [Tissierella creatinini]TJX67542.1 tRNA epoxyqueuosine(34) reductase QueG [Soehngenia saccharolytica]
MLMKKYIIEKAKELKIDMIGFTDGNPLTTIKDYLEYRRLNNIETEFEEENILLRIDPKLTLETCKSIIVIALSYNVVFDEKSEIKYSGNLSKSSWGIDYHRVLKNKLEALIEEIKKITPFEYKYFVDTGPLVDRELAHKAGIGYYGKNCNIINEEYGSFIFIGYILTDLDIEPNEGLLESQCGVCEICLKACPDKALEEGYRLNAKKCISYHTQTKDMDLEIMKKIGNNIYGCDTCQNVCPKNKNIRFSIHDEFLPHVTKGVIDIEELLIMSNKQFKEKYGSMSGSWRGRNILRRNALIALENIKTSI